ncbi:DUF732 domain-containing protein [Mycobacterium sp.]|uniref:DUF732 domain-containing protein n=1 Tax=Mycobacterium sp. TaxID=1785 RepID=UPI003D6BED85
MSTHRKRWWALSPILAIAVLAVAVGLAAPAHADPTQDYVYYSNLQNLGMVIWNPPAMRTQGLGACQDMAIGTNWRITITKLMNIGYTFNEAAMILAAATAAYCPSLDPRLQDVPPAPARSPQQLVAIT